MALTNMKNEPPKKETLLADCAVSCDSMDLYPWGLRITLNDEALKKLGMDKLPGIDEKMVLHAIVEVTSVSENASQGKDGERHENRSVELQITDMELQTENSVERSLTDKLYG